MRWIARRIRHFFQRLFRGWDDMETWNLDVTHAEWVLPRLIRFRRLSCTYPASLGVDDDAGAIIWDQYLSQMIYAFELSAKEAKIRIWLAKKILGKEILSKLEQAWMVKQLHHGNSVTVQYVVTERPSVH